jgi:hypothetical protein
MTGVIILLARHIGGFVPFKHVAGQKLAIATHFPFCANQRSFWGIL